MTEEQIKQNAEEYYQKLDSITIEDPREPNVNSIIDAYISGAHSRNEEVSKLENALCNVNEYCHQLRNKIYEFRNPWISVEDRLPEEGKCVFVRYGDVTYSLYSSAYMIEKNLWSIEGYGNGEVTHWMPIPKLNKGE